MYLERGDVFGAALRYWAARQGGVTATTFEGRATSYAQFDAAVDRIAHALAAEGLQKGDRVAYLGKNSDLVAQMTFGCARAGIIIVPIIWRLAGEEIAYILGDSGAKLLFVGDGLAASAKAAMAANGMDLPVIALDAADKDPSWRDFVVWRDAADSTPYPGDVTRDDIVVQLYTSGTTGKPKGAMMTHGNGTGLRPLLDASGIEWLQSEPGDTNLNAMPYAHIAGFGTVLGTIFVGQHLVITREFDPGLTLSIIEKFRLKRMFLVPAALKILIEHPNAARTDFSSLVTFSYGASPIPLDLLRAGVAMLGCDFIQMYGLTETWGTVVSLPPEDHRPERADKMRAAGKALPGVELAILDEAGRHLPTGDVGEVAIRSPSVMAGYWQRAEETRKALGDDGWFRTGDAGYLDAEGYLFIQDRIKDMIITGAENVYPAEVESSLYAHDDIADVAVIGVPHDKWGETVKAIVVLRPGATADGDAIITWARGRMATYKCPTSVDFVEALPRNPSGKILRRQLREPFWAGRERRVN